MLLFVLLPLVITFPTAYTPLVVVALFPVSLSIYCLIFQAEGIHRATGRYLLHPDIPTFLRPLMATFAVPYGSRDLDRYFCELDAMLARA